MNGVARILRLLFVPVPPASYFSLSDSEEIFPILQSFIHHTHVFPRDAVSSILAAEQQQREQQSASYETTKKNDEQNLSRGDVIECEFEVVVSKNRRRKRKSPDF